MTDRIEETVSSYLDGEQLARVEALTAARSVLHTAKGFASSQPLHGWELMQLAEYILTGDDGDGDGEEDDPPVGTLEITPDLSALKKGVEGLKGYDELDEETKMDLAKAAAPRLADHSGGGALDVNVEGLSDARKAALLERNAVAARTPDRTGLFQGGVL